MSSGLFVELKLSAQSLGPVNLRELYLQRFVFHQKSLPFTLTSPGQSRTFQIGFVVQPRHCPGRQVTLKKVMLHSH